MKKDLAIEKGGVVYTSKHFGNYNTIANHKMLLDLIKRTRPKYFCEYIDPKKLQTLYFDIDMSSEVLSFEEISSKGVKAIENIQKQISSFFSQLEQKFLVLTSNQESGCLRQKRVKFSAHMIVRLYEKGVPLLFSSTEAVKKTIETIFPKPEDFGIDMGVYKPAGGSLLRTIYSSKPMQNRPLTPPVPWEEPDELLSFVTYQEVGSRVFTSPGSSCLEKRTPKMLLTAPENLEESQKCHGVFIRDENPIKGFLFTKFLTVLLEPHRLEKSLGLENNSEKKEFRIRYKGYCPNVKRAHTNNHCVATFKEKNVRISCFKQDCGRGISFRMSEFLNRSDVSTLFDLDGQILAFIQQNTDPGVKSLCFTATDVRADATKHLKDCYLDLDNHPQQHIINTEGYKIVSEANKSIICSFEMTSAYKLFSHPFKRMRRSNINVLTQVNNFASPRLSTGSKRPELMPETIVDIREFFTGNELALTSLEFYQQETLNQLFRIYERMNLPRRYKITSKTGYRKKGFLWVQEKETAMRLKILREVEEIFLKLMVSTPAEYEYIEDDIRGLFDYLLTRVTNMQCNSLLVPFLDEILRDESFEQKLNANWDIVPFDNGLLNLRTGEMDLGDTSEPFNMTVGYTYEELSETPELDTILESLMPDVLTRNYLLNYLASALSDRVPNDVCLFIIGRGSNGKSLFSRLVAETFGPLFRSIPSSIFSAKDEDPHAPKPVIQQLRYARIGILSETDDVKFRAENFKRLCGNETHAARQPHGLLEEFAMKTKFIVFGNDLPEFSSSSHALWRRIRVLKFDTQFVEHPSAPNEQLVDKMLYRKIESDTIYRKQLMHKLIRIHRDGLDLQEPEISKELVRSIRTEYEEFYEFCEELIHRSRNSVLTMSEILRVYRPGEAISSNSDFYRKHVKELAKWLREVTKKFDGENFKLGLYRLGGKSVRGWSGLAIQKN